jgi:SAM-dependent methyltransferase
LGKAGYQVVGVDISQLYLQTARRWADGEDLADKVRFYRMDLRNAAQQLTRKREAKFDAVVNMGTSMGYYRREDDVRTFKNLHRITGPKSILVIETVNRDYLVKNFEPHSISKLDGLEWEDNRRLDLETSFMHNSWKFYRKTGNSRRLELEVPVSHRVYSLHELKELVDQAGWKYHNSYGSLQKLTPVTTDSFHMTIVSRKKA